MTNLSGSLPKGHGLAAIDPALIDEPHKAHIVIVVVNCKKVTTDMDTGEVEPTARITRIEAIDRSDYKQAELLLRRALERRYGSTVLPFDTEEDLRLLFAEMGDLDEGKSGTAGGDDK